MDDDVSSVWEARKLLHWVNSLPPPTCLLVETLVDLRFGDVLLDIVHWLRAQRAAVHSLSANADDHDNNADNNTAASSDREWDMLSPDGSLDASVTRLRQLMGFVAMEARSQDRDALYVVNEAQCVARVRRGSTGAICAVLCVLKRVSDEAAAAIQTAQQQLKQRDREPRRDSVSAAILDELARANKQRACARAQAAEPSQRAADSSFTRPHNVTSSRDDAHVAAAKTARTTRQRSVPAVGLKRRVALRPKTSKSRPCSVTAFQERAVPMHRDDAGHLRVYSMVDPLAHTPLVASRTLVPESELERADALRVHEWMRSLGVALSAGSLEDGVLLCQLAAAVVTRHGSAVEKRALCASPGTTLLLPLGATLQPQSAAQRRKNVAIAIATLAKYCSRTDWTSDRRGDVSDSCAQLATLLSGRAGRNKLAGRSVWELLDCVRAAIDGAGCSSSSRDASPTTLKQSVSDTEVPATRPATTATAKCRVDSALDENTADALHEREESVALLTCEKRRPFVTHEQIQAVHRWLVATVGHNVFEPASAGLLHDPLRNGALLWNVYARAFSSEKEPSRRLTRAPKTLIDVRRSLTDVFAKLSSVESCQLPPCYTSPSSREAIIMGDRQVTYGVLWHLWQRAQALETQRRQAETATVAPPTTTNEAHDYKARVTAESATRSATDTSAGLQRRTKAQRAKVSPLVLDIPAAVLTNAGSSRIGSRAMTASTRSQRVLRGACDSWGDEHPFVHDLFPQASAAVQRPGAVDQVGGIDHDAAFDGPVKWTNDSSDDHTTQLHGTKASAQTLGRDGEGQFATVNAPRVRPIAEPEPPTSSSESREINEAELRICRVESPKCQSVAPSCQVTSIECPTESAAYDVEASRTSMVTAPPPPLPPEIKALEGPSVMFREAESAHDVTPQHRGQELTVSSREAVDELLAWLKRLNIRLSDPVAFQTPSARLMEFQSGVLLCSIVEKVEYLRCIEGVSRKPRLTRANALHNIAKALEILEHKKTMPLHLLRRKSAIYSGDRAVILTLLHQIRKAYGHHNLQAASRTGVRALRTQRSSAKASREGVVAIRAVSRSVSTC